MMGIKQLCAIQLPEFESFIAENKLVCILFRTDSSAPCVVLDLVFERVALMVPSVVFACVNASDAPDLCVLFHGQSVPHLMFFKQGIAIYSESGAFEEKALVKLVQEAIELDVSAILLALQQEGELDD